jgi:methyl acetate hydrolase
MERVTVVHLTVPSAAPAFGSRNLAMGLNMTLDSVFWLASITKAITSTAALPLVEQGKLNLDRPIGGILPELVAPRCSKDSTKMVDPNFAPPSGQSHYKIC